MHEQIVDHVLKHDEAIKINCKVKVSMIDSSQSVSQFTLPE